MSENTIVSKFSLITAQVANIVLSSDGQVWEVCSADHPEAVPGMALGPCVRKLTQEEAEGLEIGTRYVTSEDEDGRTILYPTPKVVAENLVAIYDQDQMKEDWAKVMELLCYLTEKKVRKGQQFTFMHFEDAEELVQAINNLPMDVYYTSITDEDLITKLVFFVREYPHMVMTPEHLTKKFPNIGMFGTSIPTEGWTVIMGGESWKICSSAMSIEDLLAEIHLLGGVHFQWDTDPETANFWTPEGKEVMSYQMPAPRAPWDFQGMDMVPYVTPTPWVCPTTGRVMDPTTPDERYRFSSFADFLKAVESCVKLDDPDLVVLPGVVHDAKCVVAMGEFFLLKTPGRWVLTTTRTGGIRLLEAAVDYCNAEYEWDGFLAAAQFIYCN